MTSRRPRPNRPPRCIQRVSYERAGLHYDVYEPARSARKTFILLHGLTLEGENDPRLIRLATCLAFARLRIVALRLPGLMACRFDPGDVQAIAKMIQCLSAGRQEPIGLIGFSLGAGLGLIAAALPEVKNDIDSLFLFGSYSRLRDLQVHFMKLAQQAPQQEDDWDAFIWIRLVLAYRQIDRLSVDQADREEIQNHLMRYCHGLSLRDKRGFFDRVLKDLPVDRAALLLDDQLLEQLSPAHRLHDIKGRVYLLHDAHDRIVPPDHSIGIFDQLCRLGQEDRVHLLISPLLSHVSVPKVSAMAEALRLLRMISAVFVL